jgi:hypothetical protein
MKRENNDTYDFVRGELKAGDLYITTAHDIGHTEGWNEAIDFIVTYSLNKDQATDVRELKLFKRYEDI